MCILEFAATMDGFFQSLLLLGLRGDTGDSVHFKVVGLFRFKTSILKGFWHADEFLSLIHVSHFPNSTSLCPSLRFSIVLIAPQRILQYLLGSESYEVSIAGELFPCY